jgi:hypothetical protein
VTVGYNFPTEWARKINLQNIRLYGNASDILTFNKYPKGWDPEVSSTGYPITSSYVFGLSVTF